MYAEYSSNLAADSAARLPVQLVAMHKVQQASVQLRRLGFPQWQAVAAVQLAGCALHPAVQWLLECRLGSKAEAQQLLVRTGASLIFTHFPSSGIAK